MNIIRIHNHSAGAVVRSYAVTPDEPALSVSRRVIVWLELAPQHPKACPERQPKGDRRDLGVAGGRQRGMAADRGQRPGPAQ
ncbi:MAG: hypothetical protein ACE5GO_08905 [Anaerolineales bacterium]